MLTQVKKAYENSFWEHVWHFPWQGEVNIRVHHAACYADCICWCWQSSHARLSSALSRSVLQLTVETGCAVVTPTAFVAFSFGSSAALLLTLQPKVFLGFSSSPQAICCFILCPIVFGCHRFYMTTTSLCSGSVLEVCCLWSDKYHWDPRVCLKITKMKQRAEIWRVSSLKRHLGWDQDLFLTSSPGYQVTQALFHWAEVCGGPVFLLPAWFVLAPTISS